VKPDRPAFFTFLFFSLLVKTREEKMKNYNYQTILMTLTTFVFLLLSSLAALAQNGKIIATLNFDPETDGFSFENPGNDTHNWQNDLTAADMILLFGAKAVCVSGNTLATCAVRRTAENWRIKELQDMDGGHCEGMSVASLLFFEEQEFKKKKFPADYQKGKEAVGDLVFPSPLIENYIAYFHVTQLFDGVYDYRKVYYDKGPVAVVKELADSMNDPAATTYTISVQQYVNGKFKGGHTMTPIAVEDMGDYYRIHIYDNNYPGETRYLTVQKGGRQTWRYNGATNPNEPKSLYTGDISSRNFFITPNDTRYGTTFRAPFSTRQNDSSSSANKPEKVEFLVNDDADMMITAGDGKRVGYDWTKQQTVNEISGAEMIEVMSGYDDDLPPVFHLPYTPNAKPYTVTLSGKSLTEESRPDLVYTGPGFSVGFDGIRLDPNETLTFQISPDGRRISFTSSADGETPELYFSFDAPNGESYLTEVDGVELQAGKTVSGEFDPVKGVFYFKDDDGNKDKYDVDFERVLSNGKLQSFETDNLDMGAAENFEMDFNVWDGKSPMCFRDDADGKGFDNDECVGQPNEDNDLDADDSDDEGDDEDADIDNDGKFNNVDDDDDGDGIIDDKDTDDDGDDEPRFLQPLAWLIAD
jgi:hypothetical protein